MSVKTRFAPSPTGHLHVGGARTALFSYYYAKHFGGSFVLRIEDTDRERSKKEYEEEILRSLKWLGIEWDEGPYYQSQRFENYRAAAQKLLSTGQAYKCFLTAEELDKMRAEAQAKGEQFKVRSPWRDRKPSAAEENKPHAIRFRYPTEGTTLVRDGILGDVQFPNAEGDDLIILRSDGTPTYQLSVVVDDLEMGITHVIRGDDHLNNTPKQLLMIEALGGKAPNYAHAPMILGPDKAKLSKRHGAVSVFSYSSDGYLPEAFRNSLIRLGWSHGDQELFTHEELCKYFDLDGCGKSPAVFDIKKLDWMNGEFIKRMSLEEFAGFLKSSVNFDVASMLKQEGARKLLETAQRTIVRGKEAPPLLQWYAGPVQIDPDCREKVLNQTKKEWIEKISALIASDWNPAHAMDQFKSVAAELNIKMPDIAKPVRVLLTGSLKSPDMSIVMSALGKDEVLKRLRL